MTTRRPRALEAGVEGGGLPEVAPEAHEADARVRLRQARDDLRPVVAAAIVDEEDLVRHTPLAQDRGELLVELLERALLVEEGDHHGDVRRHGGGRILSPHEALSMTAREPPSGRASPEREGCHVRRSAVDPRGRAWHIVVADVARPRR